MVKNADMACESCGYPVTSQLICSWNSNKESFQNAQSIVKFDIDEGIDLVPKFKSKGFDMAL